MLSADNVTRQRPLARRLELADSLWAKFRGLMGRPGLDPDEGLWLPGDNGIHMMFMRFAIDCVFLARPEPDGVRRVVAIRRALPPWRGVVWFVRGASGVLELPVGVLDATGTAVGDAVRIG